MTRRVACDDGPADRLSFSGKWAASGNQYHSSLFPQLVSVNKGIFLLPTAWGSAHSCSSYRKHKGMSHLTKVTRQTLCKIFPNGKAGRCSMAIAWVVIHYGSPYACCTGFALFSQIPFSQKIGWSSTTLAISFKHCHYKKDRHWDWTMDVTMELTSKTEVLRVGKETQLAIQADVSCPRPPVS